MEHKALKLKVRWEHDEIPAGKTQRGLLIEVTGREVDDRARLEAHPLNLALVIDRSGSMADGRLAAACKAAIGISQQLRAKDKLSIIAYDSEVLVLLNGVMQDKSGREAVEAALVELQPRGSTDLGAGWMMGAKCVADVMQREELSSGHVLLLSDGCANCGITDPAQLAKHAGEMAARGVTSSCVGIGHGYSPLQLDAIAEAGRGQLHHSDNPDEIIKAVLGEVGTMARVAAHAVTLLLHFPGRTKLQQLTRFREQDGGHYCKLELGDITSGSTRKVAFLVDIPNQVGPGAQLPFMAKLFWKGDDQNETGFSRDFMLKVVDPDVFDPQGKRRKVARTIAELWLARMGYEAMIFNERGLYQQAVEAFVSNDRALESMVAELKDKERELLLSRKMRVQAAVAEEWSGPGKLQALSLSRKHMRSEADHTGRRTDEWLDRAPG